MPHVPDIVRLSELDTRVSSDPPYTQHVRYVSTLGRRAERQEERWQRRRELGRGTYGAVYLETCILGDPVNKVRAVKEVPVDRNTDCYRELEAIALFSHAKYQHCFVASFGWYMMNDYIYITMEYVPHGDLHQYLNTPLAEKEGQTIVRQILEGLDFMHDSGFAHRDLKPAMENILVVDKGPDWWVKIADFGISKRAAEGLTALRTMAGTPAFLAPEVLGYGQVDDSESDSYTNAVDIWSTGVIAFLILTGETLFRDPRRLAQYVARNMLFPTGTLTAQSISTLGCGFIQSLMSPNPRERPSAKGSLQHAWITAVTESSRSGAQRLSLLDDQPRAQSEPASGSRIGDPTSETEQRSKSLFEAFTQLSFEASAAWSTQDGNTRPPSVLPTGQEPLGAVNTAIGRSSDGPSVPGHTAVEKEAKTSSAVDTSASKVATNSIPWARKTKLEGHKGPVRTVAFSPDGRVVASGSEDRTVRIWDTTSGAEIQQLVGHESWVVSLAFTPDGSLLASGSGDCMIRLWDISYPPLQKPSGSWLGSIMAATNQIRINQMYGIVTKAKPKVGVFKGQNQPVWSLAFSPDGQRLAAGLGDGTIRLLDVATAIEFQKLDIDTCWIPSIGFSAGGAQIASVSGQGVVTLWDIAAKEVLWSLSYFAGRVRAIAFPTHGHFAVLESDHRKLTLWDIERREMSKTFRAYKEWVKSLEISRDGLIAASGTHDGIIRLWNLATGAKLMTFRGHKKGIESIAFSSDMRLIASGSSDCTIGLWDITVEHEA